MKVFEMFCGFGGASWALKKAGIDFECIGISETDKYAIQCFNQNFPGVKNFGDCTKINPNDLPDFDLLTGGFPCTDVSIAGKQDLNKGRTILFNEIIRIAEVKKPKFILLENVKGLLSKKFQDFFEHTLKELYRIGYNVVKVYDKKKKRNLVPVFNSKEYGIPQNRQRVFYICNRKDIDFTFKFPEKEELKIFLKDILEEEVDLKYYLSDEAVKRLMDSGFKERDISNTIRNGGRGSLDKKHTWDIVKVGNVNPSGRGINGNVYAGNVAPTITTNKGEGAKIIQLNNPTHSNNRIYSENGCSPSLNTMQGGNRQPFVFQRGRGFNKGGIKEMCPTISKNDWQQNNFLVLSQPLNFLNRNQKSLQGNYSGCVDSSNTNGLNLNGRIRKLTPKECFRLMGFTEDQINLSNLSNTQKYKLAGNGFEINVVSKIFKQIFKGG